MKLHPETVVAHFETPLGRMIAAATPSGLAGLWFEGQRHFDAREIASLPMNIGHPMLQKAKRWLGIYFDTAAVPEFDRSCIDFSAGTAFQQRVWRCLLDVKPGETTHYGGLARRMGSPLAARAVGAAVGRNPISIVVPCHRIVGIRGAMTGYAGGLERKVALLQREGVIL